MLLVFLTVFFSFFSLCMMSYLAMNTLLGPWVAPVFVVVAMVIAQAIIAKRWFQEHVVITIAAGSVGGMIGTCLGLTLPSFYLLYKDAFDVKLANPVSFYTWITLSVLCAGIIAFLIVHFIKDHMFTERNFPFPMSRFVYDMIYMDSQKKSYRLLLVGIILSSIWNGVAMIGRAALQLYGAQLNLIPMMISIGFVAGSRISIPLLIGLVTRTGALEVVHDKFFASMIQAEFLVMFCSGMLLPLILDVVISLFTFQGIKEIINSHELKRKLHSVNFVMLACIALVISSFYLKLDDVSLRGQLYALPVLFVVCFYVAGIVGEIGVVEFDSFVWFVILPIVYFVSMSAPGVLEIVMFSILCIGIVVDLLFSYKLAHIAGVSAQKVLKYQIVGFLVAAICSGFVIFGYFKSFDLGGLQLFVSKAYELDDVINFGAYNYKVVICGFLWGIIIRLMNKELLAVIGATLMSPSVSIWLIVASSLSGLVYQREKLYPLWFGVYAGHSLWMIIRAIV